MKIDYFQTFLFPDLPGQPYPVYSVSSKGRIFNLKAIIYPTSTSVKRFTRKKQLRFRSLQAKIFDALINVGYFAPLTVWREFPVIIQNHLRLKGQKGAAYFLDYYIPELSLAIELDSDLHKEDKDQIRDAYLKSIGITTFRIKNLEKEQIQKTKFKELTALMRGMTPNPNYVPFIFTENIRRAKPGDLNP